MRDVAGMERELAQARSKLEGLRANQAASKVALGEALTKQRMLFLFDRPVNEVEVAKADREVHELNDHLSDLAGEIGQQETAILELTAQLAEAKRAEAEEKAQQAEAQAVALERALAKLKPVMIEFADACRTAGTVISEPAGLGRTLTDILRHVEDDTAYFAELLRQRARVLRRSSSCP